MILRNNTGNKGKDELIEGFVIRTKPFQTILLELEQANLRKPMLNYLVIGQRGSGKTTLLFRIKYAIEDNIKLRQLIIPIIFSEEQYNLGDLANLWEHVAGLLEEAGYFQGLRDTIEKEYGKAAYEDIAFDLLAARLRAESKKLVVLFENIDAFFKKIGIRGQKKFHEILTTHADVNFIATSTTHFEAVLGDNDEYNNLFRIVELKGLNKREAIDLLLKLGDECGQRPAIEQILRKSPARIESLRRLTGGVPRTISYLFQIFLDNENGRAFKDLYQLIDTLTFLYKAELDQLSTQQQKVVDVIARNWDAIGVKDIVSRTRYESKQISAILQVLEKNQLIEQIRTGTKNSLYRIRERFMNIWFLMRFGRKKERENVIWLVRFYEAWCDRNELTKHVVNHIKNLQDGNYDLTAALYMANTFLTCENISEDLKYSLYKTTKGILPRKQLSELQKYSQAGLYEQINKLIKEKRFEGAVNLLNEVVEKDAHYYDLASFVYSRIKDYIKAEEAAEKFYDLRRDSPRASLRLAIFNDRYLKNTDKAIKFYKLALEKREYDAAYFLGEIYLEKKDFEMAEKYLLIAVDNKISDSYMSLASCYFWQNNYEKAEEFCRMAIDAGTNSAFINMGLLYERKQKFGRAALYYKKALQKGIDDALIRLGNVEMRKPKPDHQMAKDYFEMAYEKKVKFAGYSLGQFYLHSGENEQRGIQLLHEEAKKGNAEAAHVLAHHYDAMGSFEQSDDQFLESVRLGRINSLFCYTSCLFRNGRIDKKKAALEALENSLQIIEGLGAVEGLEYAFVLLWNDQVTKSIEILYKQLDKIKKIFEGADEEKIEYSLNALSQFIILLIAKDQYQLASAFFNQDAGSIDFKQVLKPVYYGLMNFMKEGYPREYLKAGGEMKEAIDEIVKSIEKYKQNL